MWSAMVLQKEKAAVHTAKRARIEAPTKEEAPLPVRLILGWGGSGKSQKGFEYAKAFDAGVIFLSLTAALLSSVPETLNLVYKLTVAAFVCRPALVVPHGVCLYIDEVSMIPPELMQAVMVRAKHCAVVCTGDVFQIQPIPVLTRGAPEPKHKWFFEAPAFKNRSPIVSITREQHRLTGGGCTEIRSVLESVAGQSEKNMQWRTALADFIGARRVRTPPEGAYIIVFTNEDIDCVTLAWAKQNGKSLNRHKLCEGLPAIITANKILKSTHKSVEYAYRNGDPVTILTLNDTSTRVKTEGGKILTVPHAGVGDGVPQIKSRIAQTADAAQGKTIGAPVHVIFPKSFFPHPAKIIVAASRSKVTTFAIPDEQIYQRGIAQATFDKTAVEYITQHSNP